LATVAALFVPLAFIGGITSDGFWVGAGSAVFWFIVFMVVRPKY
jgi:hypothetical protein